jgi:hypothetical protein
VRLAVMNTFQNLTARDNCWREFVSTCPRLASRNRSVNTQKVEYNFVHTSRHGTRRGAA